jgi:hypothetical protein
MTYPHDTARMLLTPASYYDNARQPSLHAPPPYLDGRPMTPINRNWVDTALKQQALFDETPMNSPCL